jgi:hypothetical protein
MSSTPEQKSEYIGVRIQPDLHKRLQQVARKGMYSLTMSQIVIRGIELAIAELEHQQDGKNRKTRRRTV